MGQKMPLAKQALQVLASGGQPLAQTLSALCNTHLKLETLKAMRTSLAARWRHEAARASMLCRGEEECNAVWGEACNALCVGEAAKE